MVNGARLSMICLSNFRRHEHWVLLMLSGQMLSEDCKWYALEEECKSEQAFNWYDMLALEVWIERVTSSFFPAPWFCILTLMTLSMLHCLYGSWSLTLSNKMNNWTPPIINNVEHVGPLPQTKLYINGEGQKACNWYFIRHPSINLWFVCKHY